MSSQLSEIWQKTLDILKSEFTSDVGFHTWIEPIEPLSISSNTVTLRVPDDFFINVLRSRYSLLIKNAIQEVTFKEYAIKFVAANGGQNEDSVVEQLNETSTNLMLNPKYTFDKFVIGNNNRFAHAAALAVAEAPAQSYNPLFLYGGVGLGKTHLMHAIGHYVLSQNPKAKVLYVSSEKFTNELINSIKDDRNEEFRAKYRNIDLLLIDDVQFIAGKDRTQEEFFHTFNALYESNKQIILSSDKPPKEIKTLEERLRSRFEWGLIADMQSPDYETRMAILTKKAQLEKLEVPNEVISFIADNISSNIRELEGALNRVVAYSSLTNNTMTVETATDALKNILTGNRTKIVNSNLIQNVVSRYFDIKQEDFKSKKRSREIAYPRQIAMYLCRELTDMSLPKIGSDFGGRDHTTVLHAYEKISEEIITKTETRKIVEELKKNILG